MQPNHKSKRYKSNNHASKRTKKNKQTQTQINNQISKLKTIQRKQTKYQALTERLIAKLAEGTQILLILHSFALQAMFKR